MERVIQCVLTGAVLAVATFLIPNPSAAQVSAPQESNSCQKFVGLWSWNGGSTKIDVKPDGTADVLCTLCDKNLRWTCRGNLFKLSCCVFGVDLSLAADGKQMSGARGTSIRLSPQPASETASSSIDTQSRARGSAPAASGERRLRRRLQLVLHPPRQQSCLRRRSMRRAASTRLTVGMISTCSTPSITIRALVRFHS
jgi:hypothetical protein